MLYVLSRSLAGGRREGTLSSLGTFVGGLAHVVAAGAGVSAVLASSAIAFSIVKYGGAAYLVYLGICMILGARTDEEIVTPTSMMRNPFSQGILTEALNPKTALFFLSFIPQFVNRGAGHIFLQFCVLGCISVGLNTIADLSVTMLSLPLGKRLRASGSARRRQRTATGLTMIALGTYVALGDSQ